MFCFVQCKQLSHGTKFRLGKRQLFLFFQTTAGNEAKDSQSGEVAEQSKSGGAQPKASPVKSSKSDEPAKDGGESEEFQEKHKKTRRGGKKKVAFAAAEEAEQTLVMHVDESEQVHPSPFFGRCTCVLV